MRTKTAVKLALCAVLFVAVAGLVAPAPVRAAEMSYPVGLMAGNYTQYGYPGVTTGVSLGVEALTHRTFFTLAGNYSPTAKVGVDRMYSTDLTGKMYYRPTRRFYIGGGLKWSYTDAQAPERWTKSFVYPTLDLAVGDPRRLLGYGYVKFSGSDSVNKERGIGLGLRSQVPAFASRGSGRGGRMSVDLRVDYNQFEEPWGTLSAWGQTILFGYSF